MNLMNGVTRSQRLRQVIVVGVRFAAQVALVYLSVRICSPWIAGRVHESVFQGRVGSSKPGVFQFFFSHLFIFSIIPTSVAGLVNYRYRDRTALFVWILPLLILSFQFFTFPSSVMVNRTTAAYSYYFGTDFVIPEYRDYSDLFSLASHNPDVVRGIDQERFVGPLYGGLAYSLSSWLCITLGSHTSQRGNSK
jgi:hypothetical protein